MSSIIVAYDGTPHADDALVLGDALSSLLGAPIALAHVHRADPRDRRPSVAVSGRERFLRREGERLLERASEVLGGKEVSHHAIAGTTTASALRGLAEQQDAQLIVFGAARDGSPGRVHPGSAARRLLQSARCGIALAPAGFREQPWSEPYTIAEDESADLIIIRSHVAAREGKVTTSAAGERVIRIATSPVIVLPHGVQLGVGNIPAAQAA